MGLSNQIPTNLGVDGDETEIYFVNFADLMIGEDMDLVIDLSKEATYKDGSGNVVSAFQRDQTLIRVIAKHDFGPRHVESIVVATGVDWGAGM
ncbi:Phage capsid family protein [compost metagenome]